MTLLTKIALGLIGVLLAGLAVSQWQLTSRDRQLRALQLAPQKAATVTAAAKVETVTVQLAAAERVVTRTLTQVRTDTLMLAPRTRQDTLTALVQLPALAEAHDSLQRSCSAFVVSCDAYRTAAVAQRGADSVYIVGLEGQLHAAEPGRLAAIWNKVKMPLAFGGGIYLGLRAR